MTETPGRISKDTGVSIALVIALIGAAWYAARWTSEGSAGVREALADIKTDVRVIGEQIQGIRNDIASRPTLIEVRAMIDTMARLRERDVEQKLDELRSRIQKLETGR